MPTGNILSLKVTPGRRYYVASGSSRNLGRFHEQTDEEVLLKDVGIHDGSQGPLESWLEKLRKFGIPVDERAVLVPAAEVVGVERLS